MKSVIRTPHQRCGVLAVGVLSVGLANNLPAQRLQCTEPSTEQDQVQADQKVVLLERLIGETDPVRRVESSGAANATQALALARASAVSARMALDSGCNTDAAQLAAAGLAQASTAFRLVRDVDAALENEYRQLWVRSLTLLEVLALQPAEIRGIDAADTAGIERQIDHAQEFAINGEYSRANGLLRPVADRLERRIGAIFDKRTVVYDRSFAGPGDEFAYLKEQYRGYRLLLARANDERHRPNAEMQSYEGFLVVAEAHADEAIRLANLENWHAAIQKMQEAITQCERATRLLGIGY